MSPLLKKVQNAEAAPPAFTPSGKRLRDGSVRYSIPCHGVFWSKVVPPGASVADYQAAEAERNRKLKELSGRA